jgi:UDP-N-acetylmuramoyl-L-alanyl-D-glutamate--2,6-diaminopimelate ligase
MTLAELLDVVVDAPPVGCGKVEVHGVVCDSRLVRAGDVFVAIPGTNEDGWAYVDDAIRRGAVAVVGEHVGGLEKQVVQVSVPDAHQALALLAARVHHNPADRMRMIGITGTNGKSTCATMIRDVLADAGRTPGLISTVAYEFGQRSIPASRTTPGATQLHELLDQMVHAGCTDTVMEVSSHALVQKRVAGIDFDIGVFTNLTQDHLDYHGDMDAYFQAKALLFQGLGKGKKAAHAVINVDNEWGERLADMLDESVAVTTYGLERPAMVQASDVRVDSKGTRFLLKSAAGDLQVTMRILGRFNVSNALACIAVCGVMGIEPALVSAMLAEMHCVRGRLEQVPIRAKFQVFVDYAHTDDALANVLVTLREITDRRLIVVFGCGGNRDVAKRPLMARAAADNADVTVVTSDNPRAEDPLKIIEHVCAGFTEEDVYEVVADRREAIGRALALAGSGDVVLVAGKGHEEFQELAHRTVPFDDVKVVIDEMKKR